VCELLFYPFLVIGVVGLAWSIVLSDVYMRTCIIALIAYFVRVGEIKRHSDTGVFFLYSIIFIFCAVNLCLPIWDQLKGRTRVGYQEDSRYTWLLRLRGLPHKKVIFRVNMYTLTGGLLATAYFSWFLWWDIITNLSPSGH